MTWMRFSDGYRLDPAVEGSPEALVVLLPDLGAAAGMLAPVAARWAIAVPATAFLTLDTIDPVSRELPADTARELDRNGTRGGAERATPPLQALLEHQLRCWRLNASQLVMVGFGYGGTVALHMALHQGWSCAGVLAFAAKLIRPLPRAIGVAKVRLIGCVGDARHNSLRGDVATLTARGIDTRGVLLSGSTLSQEAIRHGGAYLVELVAAAQRGDRFKDECTARGSPARKRCRGTEVGR
jgi:predicted esterase